jgi:hypothetical protein
MEDNSRWSGWFLGFLLAVASGVVVAIIVGEGRFSSVQRDQVSPESLSIDTDAKSLVPAQDLPLQEPTQPIQGEESSSTPADLQEEASQESQNVLTSESDPIDAVRSYWSALSSNNYSIAWSGLSEPFKIRNHSGDYSDYVHGQEGMRVCSITVGDAALRYSSDGNPIVDAVVWFQAGRTCRTSQESFSFYMRSSPEREWLIDRVVRR